MPDPWGTPVGPPRPDLVDELVQALDDAATRVASMTDTDPAPVLRLLQSARDAVQAAGAVLAMLPEPPGLGAWRHELRVHVGAMAGWAVLFSQRQDPATRAHATDVLERNAKDLAQLLARPPG